MFPSCELSTVSQVVSQSRCSDVHLPFCLLLLFSVQTPDCIAASFYGLERIQSMTIRGSWCFQVVGDKLWCKEFAEHGVRPGTYKIQFCPVVFIFFYALLSLALLPLSWCSTRTSLFSTSSPYLVFLNASLRLLWFLTPF